MVKRTLMLSMTLLFATCVLLHAAEVLDRIVATVNGYALLQSDLNDEIGYESFMSGRAVAELSADDRKAALNRLIDQQLLKEQMHASDFKPATPEEVSKQMDSLKADYAHEHGQESWDSALQRYGIDESVVHLHVEIELNQLRLVENRLRPSIQIDSAMIEQYYRQQLVPRLSGKQISLSEAAPKIRDILVEQHMNEALDTWLESLRSQAQVRILSPDSPSASGER